MKLPQRLKLVLRSRVPAEQVALWKGHHPTDEHYDVELTGSVEVRGPGGELVCVLLRDVLSEEAVAQALPELRWMRRFTSDNRGQYAGARKTGNMVKEDGTVSKSSRALDEDGKRVVVASMIAGFYEQQGGRHPYCRATGYVRHHPERWEQLQPLLRECAQVYAQAAPVEYARQMKVVRGTHPAWIIPDTPFTTVTVNNTVAAAYHVDGGDLKDGLGVLLGMEHGSFDGFQLVVPEYRVALRLQARDVLLFDPTVWHGNVPPRNAQGEQDEDWWRVSVVLYYREGLRGCGSPEEELARVKGRGTL